jgi:hypothetical protein
MVEHLRDASFFFTRMSRPALGSSKYHRGVRDSFSKIKEAEE